MFLHFLAEQWSRQVTNAGKDADYHRDNKEANEVELNTAGVTFGEGIDVNKKAENAPWNLIAQIVDKEGNVVGYSQFYAAPGEKEVVRELTVEQRQALIKKILKRN